MLRIKRSRESRIGGGARCSRRHLPRNSKIVAAESRASSSARLIAAFSMSAAAPRLDVVAADPIIGLERCERKTKLPFHRARQKPAHTVLLPVCRLHHLWDARPCWLAQQGEHAFLLGNALARLVFTRLRRSTPIRVAFEAAGCGGAFFGLGAPDGGLRRDGPLGLVFPFLGAVLPRF
jgi:hypothetical protein